MVLYRTLFVKVLYRIVCVKYSLALFMFFFVNLHLMLKWILLISPKSSLTPFQIVFFLLTASPPCFCYPINARLNALLLAVCIASNSGICPLITSTYLFPFPSFFGAFAALRLSVTSRICIVKTTPSVYRPIVSISSLFSRRYNAFARLFAPRLDHLIRRCFIRMVITVQFWLSCTPICLYISPSGGSGIFTPCLSYCPGQKAVAEKSNEITAIPRVLESIEIKGQVVTIDAMGTRTAIAETIRKRRADYVLAVKGNQGNLEEDIRQYFEDKGICTELRKGSSYKKTTEKAHGQIEIREYYQTEDTAWMHQKSRWKGLKSIGMEKKTIRKGEIQKEEYRYYISSLCEDIELFSRAVRGHWAVESMHWHLDVTFKEDANTTLDKIAAQNQNIIRKWCLSMLKLIEIRETKMSLRRKRFNISFAPAQFIEELMKI